MNELMKFHKFLGVESARVTPLGSTPASPVPAVVRLSLGQERDRGTCVSFRCHLASPAENTGEIHGHPVGGPVLTCEKAGRTQLWQTVKIPYRIRPLEV